MEDTQKAVPAPDDDPELEKLAQEAHALEEAVKAEAETMGWQSLTHTFPKPFVYEGKTFETALIANTETTYCPAAQSDMLVSPL